MRGLGIATVVLLAAGGLAAVYLGVRSIPDIQRYMKVRRM